MKRSAVLAQRAGRVAAAGALVLSMSLSGCASYYYGSGADGVNGARSGTAIIEANHQAADMLLQGGLAERGPDTERAVLVATLVNVDRLNESSRLGRIFSEQIAGRLVQRGLRVTELKLRDSVALRRDQGELLLSREAWEVSQSHDAQAVVVGTYAVSATALYVSLKLVKPEGNTVVAAHNYAVPMDDNVRALLTGR